MLQARQIAMLDGRPIYKDCKGTLCIETSDFQHLRGLTRQEESKLSKTLKAAMNLVEMGGGSKERSKEQGDG